MWSSSCTPLKILETLRLTTRESPSPPVTSLVASLSSSERRISHREEHGQNHCQQQVHTPYLCRYDQHCHHQLQYLQLQYPQIHLQVHQQTHEKKKVEILILL